MGYKFIGVVTHLPNLFLTSCDIQVQGILIDGRCCDDEGKTLSELGRLQSWF